MHPQRAALLRIRGPTLVTVALLFFATAIMPASAQAQDGCPLNFTATGTTDGSVIFHWSGFGGADGYQVFGYQGQGNTAGYSPMLNGDARDYTRQNLALGNYTFWVTAYHSGTVVASSCQRTTHVGPGPGIPQPCPENVTASFELPSSVFVQWSRVENASGYVVARAVDGGPLQGNYGVVGQSNHPGFTDGNATPDHEYRYVIVSQGASDPRGTCAGVTIGVAAVPFFPSALAFAFGMATVLGAIVFMTRKRT